jgi:UDP-N-acetylmuramate--alanine ligase
MSSAIPENHVEIQAARDRGIPVYKRKDMLGALLDGHKVIAVAGTHGKTTTTSMIIHILRFCGLDPSYIIGGILKATGTNAGVGSSDFFVIEADEYDNMFHGIYPRVAVLTNVEYDHPDFFKSEAELVASFEKFIDNVASVEGGVYVCAERELAMRIVDNHPNSKWFSHTFGINQGNAVRATDIYVDENGYTCFTWSSPDREFGIPIKITLPGRHNVLNATVAITVAQGACGPPFRADEALLTFESTARRFDVRDDIGGIAVIDDYAHHPTAIKTTLEAAKARYPERELWAVWQPHMYSRTQTLLGDYATAFEAADHVIITEIYAAREAAIEGVTGRSTADAIQHADVRHTPTFADAVELLGDRVKSPAVVLIMSAGDAPQIGIDFVNIIRDRLSHADGGVTKTAR